MSSKTYTKKHGHHYNEIHEYLPPIGIDSPVTSSITKTASRPKRKYNYSLGTSPILEEDIFEFGKESEENDLFQTFDKLRSMNQKSSKEEKMKKPKKPLQSLSTRTTNKIKTHSKKKNKGR